MIDDWNARFVFARVSFRVREGRDARSGRAEERDARERARASVECACACVMRGLTRALVVVASAVIFGRGGDAATCVEPKTRGDGVDVETFRARAVALGIDLCVDATDRARGASLGVDASCDETILSVACDVALVDAPFACSAKTRVDGRRFRACVAPLCRTSVCSKTSARDVDDDDDGLVDARSSSLARAVCREACGGSARDARFGANWQTSAFNPVNVNAALGSFVSSNPNAASLVQSFLRVQATLWLLRSIYDAVVQSMASSPPADGFATPPTWTPTPPTWTPTPPSTIFFPTPSSPSPVPSPVPSTCGVGVADSCHASCGLCIYPDATSDVPTCCCDDTCAEYGDCCVDVDACCPSLDKKANSRARARSRPRARTRSRAG